ncbi:MAG: translation initiation factor IF-1 [Verrucomicrobia bacterium]|nr:translation initiation factor IF-1 [Verrucomicrobiota bacterium]
MPRKGVLEVEGAVVEMLPDKMCIVELANGHRMRVYATRKARLHWVPLALGNRVQLKVSPGDLSSGRLIVEKQTS